MPSQGAEIQLAFSVFLHILKPAEWWGSEAEVLGISYLEVLLWWALKLRRTWFEWLTTSKSFLLINMGYYHCSWLLIPIKPVFLIIGVGKWMALISEWLLRCSYRHFITSCHWQVVLRFPSLPSLSLVFLFHVLLSHIFTCFAFFLPIDPKLQA